MVTPPPSSTDIVLDTSCVRGTPRVALRTLVRRGFRVQVSGLALDEMAVYFAQSRAGAAWERERTTLRARMNFLSGLLVGVPPIAPTHTPLVDKLGGEIVGGPKLPYSTWLRVMRTVWSELSSGGSLSPEIAAYVERNDRYVKETGTDFVETSKTIAAFGEPTPADLEFWAEIPRTLFSIVDRIRLPHGISAADRFDAFCRLLDLHGERAFDRAVHRRPAMTENHAIDLNLLQHLADGLIVVTRDYEFIEEVDASQTIQAPWVRTVGELLLGMIPTVEPFPENAGRSAQHRAARTRASLAALDQEGDRLARADEATTQD